MGSLYEAAPLAPNQGPGIEEGQCSVRATPYAPPEGDEITLHLDTQGCQQKSAYSRSMRTGRTLTPVPSRKAVWHGISLILSSCRPSMIGVDREKLSRVAFSE